MKAARESVNVVPDDGAPSFPGVRRTPAQRVRDLVRARAFMRGMRCFVGPPGLDLHGVSEDVEEHRHIQCSQQETSVWQLFATLCRDQANSVVPERLDGRMDRSEQSRETSVNEDLAGERIVGAGEGVSGHHHIRSSSPRLEERPGIEQHVHLEADAFSAGAETLTAAIGGGSAAGPSPERPLGDLIAPGKDDGCSLPPKLPRSEKHKGDTFRPDEETLDVVLDDGSVAGLLLTCPQSHGLKRRRANVEYECDICSRTNLKRCEVS